MNDSTMFAAQHGGGVLAAAVSEMTGIGLYLTYAITAVSLVVVLARSLYRNGQLFLDASFEDPELANAVNRLLVIGFFLLTLGYALLVYQVKPGYDTLTAAFNELVIRIGILLLSLGVIHLSNMVVFWKIGAGLGRRRRRMGPGMPPPPAPTFVPAPDLVRAPLQDFRP